MGKAELMLFVLVCAGKKGERGTFSVFFELVPLVVNIAGLKQNRRVNHSLLAGSLVKARNSCSV